MTRHSRSPLANPIAVLGAPPEGLAAALDLVKAGHHVIVWDDDAEAIGEFREGRCPLAAPEDRAVWRLATGCGLLTFTTYMADAVTGCRTVLLALPPCHAMPLFELYALIETIDTPRVVRRVRPLATLRHA